MAGGKQSDFGIFSFFTGAGFLDLGFEDAGFKSYLATEIDPNFAEVYRYSRKRMKKASPVFGLVEGDVCSYLEKREVESDLRAKMDLARKEVRLIGFVGGPPCPDFSVGNANAKGEKGARGRLTRTYVDIICRYEPDFFVLENVKGLLSTSKHREFFDRMVRRVQGGGYATSFRLINALEYGAAQDRQRVILIGIKAGVCADHLDARGKTIRDFPWMEFITHPMTEIDKIDWPTISDFSEDAKRTMPHGVIEALTVQHWFERNDVENHPNADDYFIPRGGLSKMKTFAEGDDSRKCYKRLHRWRYSPTACYGNNEVHLHPYKARRISVAEALAIQSLPKSFELPSGMPLSAKFKTIGNGVPYVAAKGVARTLLKYLEMITK